MPAFRDLVYALVAMVPYGRVTSYGRIAALLGYMGKAREVGWALHAIPRDLDLHPHRIVRQDGSMAGGSAFGDPEVQRALLEAEGITIQADGRVNLERHLWSSSQARAAAEQVLRQHEPASGVAGFDRNKISDYNAPFRGCR